MGVVGCDIVGLVDECTLHLVVLIDSPNGELIAVIMKCVGQRTACINMIAVYADCACFLHKLNYLLLIVVRKNLDTARLIVQILRNIWAIFLNLVYLKGLNSRKEHSVFHIVLTDKLIKRSKNSDLFYVEIEHNIRLLHSRKNG